MAIDWLGRDAGCPEPFETCLTTREAARLYTYLLELRRFRDATVLQCGQLPARGADAGVMRGPEGGTDGGSQQ